MFICTFNKNTYEQLKDKLKLVQQVRSNKKIMYIFEFDEKIYGNYSDKEIFISNKLFF